MEGLTIQQPLVGRTEEIARLEHVLAAAATGGVVLTIEGEPGIGKTSVLRQLATLAEDDHRLVLDGRATEIEANLPFAVFLDALDDYLASLNPRSFTFADEAGRGALGRIFPSLAELASEAPDPVQEERYRLHAAARRMLEWLANRRPTVICLDDVHWADEASLELLSHLLRHTPGAPLLLAVAFRSGQAPARVSDSLAEAELHGGLERIVLQALTESETAELIGERTRTGEKGALFELSGGNPFYAEQLARAWDRGEPAARPAAAPRVGANASVPDAVIGAIARELGDLDSTVEGVLRGAAVLGEGFEPDLAGEVASIETDASLAALDELLARDLVRPTDSPRRFRFRHPIVRQAVYEAAPAGWRLGAHGRAATALERRGAAPASLAHHLECSAVRGDEGAITALTETAESIAPRAPAAAAHWYGCALRLLPEGAPERRLPLLVPMARALAAGGSFDESLEAIEEIRDLMPPEAAGVRARVVASAAAIKHLCGRPSEARSELLAALAELDDQHSPDASALKLQLAGDCFYRAEFVELERWVREALVDAEAREDRVGIAAATGLLSAALYMRDQMAEARETLDAAMELLPKLTDLELAQDLHAYSYTALGAACLERFDEAIPLLERTIRVALETGHGHLPALMRTTQAFVYLWQGELDLADPDLEAAVEASILTRNPIFLAWALALQSWSALIRGNLSDARRLAEEAIKTAEANDDPVTASAAIFLADALIASSDAERARDQLLTRSGGPELTTLERGTRSRAYEILTRAELDLGDIDAAESWAERGEAAADGIGIPGRTADALRARAALELQRGDTDRAAAAAKEAAEVSRAAGSPIEAARAEILLGQALAAAGDAESGGELLKATHAALERLGAGHYADQASQELRALGIRVSRSGRRRPDDAQNGDGDGVAALSARELEIAELVAIGQRNREIAETLFLSVRTVEGHLRRIFGKLGITSRTQLATLMREREG